MPYLTNDNKCFWDETLENIKGIFKVLNRAEKNISSILVAGTLNYLFTKIAHIYINIKGENYQNYNDIIGALECAKLELYRRKISVYEDVKIKSNGDV